MVDIDLGDMSKLTVIAYLQKRGERDMAAYVTEGVAGAAAKKVADVLAGKVDICVEHDVKEVANDLLGWADERIGRTQAATSPRQVRTAIREM
jgi:hypothetical protein